MEMKTKPHRLLQIEVDSRSGERKRQGKNNDAEKQKNELCTAIECHGTVCV